MTNAKYRVSLSDEERSHLRQMMAGGKGQHRQMRRAQILLKSDENGANGWTDNQIMAALDVSLNTIAKVRKAYVQDGLKAALERKKPQRVYELCMDGEAEAHLIALTCSAAPQGCARWTLRLLANRMLEMGYVEHVSHETIRQVLKKRT